MILNFFPTSGGSGKDISEAVVTLGASLEYTGAVQTQQVASVVLGSTTLTDGTDYVVLGNTGTNAGSYQLTVLGFGDYSGYVTAAWSISKKSVAKPTVSVGTYTYNGSAQGPTITGFDSTTMTKTGDSATNPGSYTLDIALKDNVNTEWSDHTTANITESWSIGKIALTKPVIVGGSFTYAPNTVRTPTTDANYDSTTMSKSGNTSATNAGSYTLTVSLQNTDIYEWADHTTAALSLAWSIAKAQGSISVNPASLSIEAGDTGTSTITRTGDGNVTVNTSNSSIATASISGDTVTVTGVARGSATITVTMDAGDNYLGTSATIAASIFCASVFGVVWHYSNTSTALTRLTPSTDPNGYVTETVSTEPVPAVGTTGGSSPFDNYMPWSGMDEYNIINGAVSYKKGDSGFSRSDYDTMVYIPSFYSKIIKDTANSDMYFYVADRPVEGFDLHPGSNSYVGRYHTANSSGYVSKTGLAAVASITRATSRTNSHSKGNNWWQWGVAQWMAIQLLYLVEFADFNSQSKIGIGRAYASGSGINSGNTDSMTYHTGRASGTENRAAVQYRHIENLWGNYYNFVDGLNFNSRAAYACTDPSKFADDTSTNYTAAGLTLPSSNGYITGMDVSSALPWLMLPAASGGSSTTYVPDQVMSNTDWRIAAVAGTYNTSTSNDYGLFYIDGSRDSSYSINLRGSRLMFIPS